MARVQATDFLHNMRFHVEIAGAGSREWLQKIGRDSANTGNAPAGFAQCSLPDISVGAAQYKEGTMVYHRKYPGDPQVGAAITLTRGVARHDSSFWLWMRCVVEGSGEYRADLQIKHFHREQALTRNYTELNQGVGTGVNKTMLDINKPARTYHVFEAWPTQHQVGQGGLDSGNGEVSIMEIACEYEHFEVEEHAAT